MQTREQARDDANERTSKPKCKEGRGHTTKLTNNHLAKTAIRAS